MRKLMIINSCFNLILGIQIREKFLQGEDVDLILGGDSQRLETVSKNDTLNKIFQNVRFIPYKECAFHYFDIINPENYLKRVLNDKPLFYSDIYFWNPDKNLYNFVKYYKKCKHDCKLHLYCDAIGGYSKDRPENDEKWRFWGGIKGSIYNFIDKYYFGFYNVGCLEYDYYLFKPQLFMKKTSRKMIQIPDVTEKDVDVFNKVFDYQYQKIEQKYIFLDTARDGFTTFEDVFKVILFIADIIGKDNIAIKIHPRECRKSYEKLGIKVMDNGIPWELYCMNGIEDNIVVVAPLSSAAVLPYILTHKNYNVICVADLIPNSHPDYQGLYCFFEKISEMTGSINMVHSFKELKLKLGEEK